MDKNVEKVLNLFDKNVIYYETPYEVYNGVTEIKQLWLEIENQEIDDLDILIICNENLRMVVNWKMRYKIDDDYNELDGIYFIELNEDGKCTLFKQWYMEKGK
ncbi:MAG: hypothetical protein A2Y24_06185 [Clostridiales bacterium GWE2_32_10]|nr:MAG: hypothetical protein A2Y24_06185 [Clostridiales bacterium GWE2_32_10]HBY20583.1 hypothetical protein [Clostridiales bacterium]